MKNIFLIILFGSLLGFGCTNKANLGNFDIASWRADIGGCNTFRTSNIEELKKLRQQFKGMTGRDLSDLMGRPDIQRLDERNQEYYVYFLEKGPHCGSLKPVSDAKSIIFRFSAINLCTEVTFQNGSI